MTLRTITFDDSTHKLVPIIADESMLQKGEYYCESALLVWRDMTAAAPEYQDIAQSVVEENGKLRQKFADKSAWTKLLKSKQDTTKAELKCGKCGADRFKEPCRQAFLNCPMVATAHTKKDE